MTNEISLAEFRRDIRKQKAKGKKRKAEKEPAKAKKEMWEKHPEALSKNEYDERTRYGRYWLKKPRPVWFPERKKWSVGAPVNPAEWQILIQSEPASELVTRKAVEDTIIQICGWFRMNDFTFSKCVSRLCDKQLLKIKGGARHSKIVDMWLHPELSGLRAGGEWHRSSIHNFIDIVNRELGCFTYADRGFYSGFEMPDIVIIKPRLVAHTVDYHEYKEPLEWDMKNSIYAEFKSKEDMIEHRGRLEKQLEQYQGVPLYLEVQDRILEAKEKLEEYGRREVEFVELLRKAEGDMVYLIGGGYREAEKSFKPVIRRVREALFETYDRKARLAKTGTDPQGRECHTLILYDRENTAKNIGQVIPDYAENVKEFVELYFGREHLGRVATVDYIYTPERKPTDKNKTWKWEKRKTKGLKFRSFSVK